MPVERNRRVGLALAAVIPVMVSLCFAAVPFYSWFCRVTGYGGTISVVVAPHPILADRVVTVRFDSNAAPDMPWEFRPKQRTMQLKLGETGMALYEAYNPTDEVVAGQAGYNVAPDEAGRYFHKIACFCFTHQVLRPHERVDMPVTFYVDPDIIKDPVGAQISTVTLSYTMFRIEVPEDERTAAPTPAGAQVAAGRSDRRSQPIAQ